MMNCTLGENLFFIRSEFSVEFIGDDFKAHWIFFIGILAARGIFALSLFFQGIFI
jgi:hypothetical protein